MKTEWMTQLREKSFRGWPEESEIDKELYVKEVFSSEEDGIQLTAYDFTAQGPIQLRLFIAHRSGLKPEDLEMVVLNVLDQQGWESFVRTYRPGFEKHLPANKLPEGTAEDYESQKKMFAQFKWGMAYLAPRGIGLSAWDASEKKQTQIRRRFMLLGQTQDSMRGWDIRRAIHALRQLEGYRNPALWIQSERNMAGNALYASLFEPDIARLDLWSLPTSHREGPVYLNVLRYLDIPQAVTMAAEKSKLRLYANESEVTQWLYPQRTLKKLDWPSEQIQIRKLPSLKQNE